MADVMQAFIAGRSARQQLDEQREDRRLRQKILKHQIDQMKIEDELQARQAALEHVGLLQGQPEADLPADVVTEQIQNQAPNLPSRNLAGALLRTPNPQGAVNLDPAFIPAPAAQPIAPGTHPVEGTRRFEQRVIRPVRIPGLPSLGIPETQMRPMSAEQVAQVAIEQKRLAQAGQLTKVGAAEALVALDPVSGQMRPVYQGEPKAPERFEQFKQAYAEQLGATSFEQLPARARIGVHKAYAEATRADQAPPQQWIVKESANETTGEPEFWRVEANSGRSERIILPKGIRPGKGDDPELPRGIQGYLLQLRSRYGTFDEAVQELARTWGTLLTSAPRLSADKTVEALRKQFGMPAGSNSLLGLLSSGAAAAPTSGPSPAPSSPPGVAPGAIVQLKDGRRIRVKKIEGGEITDWEPAP